jgi:type II secretory pathway pseudopilin PulG
MKDEGGRMNNSTARTPRSVSSFILHPSSFKPAFTLTELLIVIGLIVLILVLAVPALDFITGSRSIDGAQNQISAMLGRARAEAIGLQEPMGIAFFRDPANDRITMALVEYTDTTADPAETIDFIEFRDQQVLQPGIGMQLVNDPPPGEPDDPYVLAGVIMFDGFGRVVHQQYEVAGTNIEVQHTANGSVPTDFPSPVYSQFGFVLYDRAAYENVGDDAWLDANALPVLVNRYNGTLVKGE